MTDETNNKCGTEIEDQKEEVYIATDPALIADNIALSFMKEPFNIIVTLIKDKAALGFIIMPAEQTEKMLLSMYQQVKAIRAANQLIIIPGSKL